jgi:hypothetical protein
VLVVSLAGCPSLSCRGAVAAVVFDVGSVAGGSVRCRRPRRRMKAAVAARAPAAPVRSAASRFFPAPRESSRLRPDVTSPNALLTLAGNPGLRFARERRVLTPPGSATRRLEGLRPACRRLDGRRAVSLVGMRSSLRSVGVWCRWVRAVARGGPPAAPKSSVAFVVKFLLDGPIPQFRGTASLRRRGPLETGRPSCIR